ncbi:hypothetical protein [Bradyrhizobium sp. CB3481]|uniref:hypothetical protein n=1 Tax=Bradyrhizobium sp. CB3481 TaxID=3039158 RepID=UPI0024B27F37|nr:hypothetical protein [Bradyrhizobium sp. CB3481]WFU14410.1 hypothetical protein QA643_24850 [Bradyrhizobium sp. CB3481]
MVAPNDDMVSLPANNAPAIEQQPQSAPIAGAPGTARICLTDKDIRLGEKAEILIPATTVFRDEGPNVGKLENPSTWRYEIKQGSRFAAQLATLSAVSLSKKNFCAETKVQMLTGPGASETAARASDKHVFAIDNVVDYPIPLERPAIEIGKLIDDISVLAVLITDVSQAMSRPKPPVEDEAQTCLARAKRLAAYLGGGTGRQRTMNVEIGRLGKDSITYGCPSLLKRNASFEVYWDGQAKPLSTTLAIVAKGGEYVIGASRAEIMTETTACVDKGSEAHLERGSRS